MAALLALALLAAGVQAWLLSTDRIPFNSDQAIVALMAKQIAEGKGHPVFYWGATYAGSFEPHVVAGVFYLVGPGRRAYRAAMGLLVWVLLAAVVLLAFRSFGSGAALVSLLYLAVPPFFFPYKGFTSDGAYATVMLVAATALLFALAAESRLRNNGRPAGPMFLLGLALGIGFWVTPVTLPVTVTAVVWLFLRRAPRPSLRAAAALAAGAAAGSFPWWVWNLRHGWESLRAHEIRLAVGRALLENVWTFLRDSLPVLTGAAGPLFTDDRREPFPFASFVLPAVTLVLLVPLVRRATRGDGTLRLLLPASGLVVLGTIASGRFLSTEPRYAVALYAIVPPLLGAAYVELRRAGHRALAVAGLAVLVAGNAGSLYQGRRHLPETLNDKEVTASLGDLPETLLRLGADRVYANYWTAYRLAFESGEKILATPIPAEEQTRWEPYKRAVVEARNPAVVLLPPRAECFEKFLLETGQPFARASAGRFRIFRSLPEAVLDVIRRSGGLPLPKEACRVAWQVLSAPSTLAAGGTASASVLAKNVGTCVWMPSVHLGYRWRPVSGAPPLDVPEHSFPHRRVEPDESVRFDLSVKGPSVPGRYDLEFDLVQEDIAWFSWRGGATARVPVEVR